MDLHCGVLSDVARECVPGVSLHSCIAESGAAWLRLCETLQKYTVHNAPMHYSDITS